MKMKNDFTNGFIANLPIGFSVFAYGGVLGMLCVAKGVSLLELVLMNFFIFAGSAQFVMVDMWSESLNVFSIVSAALMINLRYFLIGASLNPLFKTSTKTDKFRFMHLVADENWAITMNTLKRQQITPMFLFGGGVCLLIIWSFGTILGYKFGSFIADPYKYGLDFAFIAIFSALSFDMFRGKNDLLPWSIAAFSAIVCEHFIPNKSYIIIGAIAGSLSAVFLHKKSPS